MESPQDTVYQTFVQKAADGRGLSFEELEAMARGRVWTGLEAVEVVSVLCWLLRAFLTHVVLLFFLCMLFSNLLGLYSLSFLVSSGRESSLTASVDLMMRSLRPENSLVCLRNAPLGKGVLSL